MSKNYVFITKELQTCIVSTLGFTATHYQLCIEQMSTSQSSMPRNEFPTLNRREWLQVIDRY